MGSSPAQQYQSAAKSTFNKAVESQEQLTANLRGQAGEYLGKNAPSNFAQASRELRDITGASPEDYVRSTRESVYPQLQNITDTMRGNLASFDPGVIGRSTDKLNEYLLAATQRFQEGVTGQAKEGSQRVWESPGRAREAFAASYLMPEFEMQKDVNAMAMAENPKTVSQVTDPRFQSGFRKYTTYNV